MTSNVYAETFAKVIRSTNVDTAIRHVRDRYGLANVTYHLAHTVGSPIDTPFVRTTYPDSWVGHYVLNNLANIDPVVCDGFNRTTSFLWTDLTDQVSMNVVLDRAKPFGLGASGYSVPIIDKKGRKALLSVNSHQSEQEWRSFVDSVSTDLGQLAYDIHLKAITEVFRTGDKFPNLGPRELECLTWTAKGKTYSEIATILSLSDHTVRTYLKTVRFKLDCITLAQAVAKAGELRLI